MQTGNNSQGVARLGRPQWWICSHLPRVKEQASAPIIAPRGLCEHTHTLSNTHTYTQAVRLDKVIGRGVTAQNSQRPHHMTSTHTIICTPDCVCADTFVHVHTDKWLVILHILIISKCRQPPYLHSSPPPVFPPLFTSSFCYSESRERSPCHSTVAYSKRSYPLSSLPLNGAINHG